MERLTKEMGEYFRNAGINYLPKNQSGGYFEILNKLGELEDLEEQGLLLKLPFVLGQVIYWVTTKCNAGLEEDDACDKYECDECPYAEELAVVKGTAKSYHVVRFLEGTLEKEYFLTKAEAEKALAEMKGE